MILVDHQLRVAIKEGKLGTNFEEEFIQPASYDLRIGANVYTSDSLDRPTDLSRNGGAHRIPPYAIAVLQTYETFDMPDDWVGRFGLKSSFARRGLFASTGPQVDPGFKGKLIISLMNQTNRSHVIGYKEEFLTIEFNKLEFRPDQTYHGPYQHREDVGPEILSDLVRLEGMDLTQMQMQFTELTQHVKEWSNLASRFDEFLKVMNDMNQLTQKVLAERRTQPIEPEVVEARDIPIEQAKREILEFFEKHPDEDVYYGDIAEELQLSYSSVIEAFEELKSDGNIEEAEK